VAEKKGPVVVIDNYDSFTYNLCQASTGSRVMPHLLHALAAMRAKWCGCVLLSSHQSAAVAEGISAHCL
jgi:anthranilate/para-aminobenzoate synthase component II